MKRGIIFAAGSFYGLRQTIEPEDMVIAADAGYLTCRRLGIRPRLLVGDFDSMPEPEICDIGAHDPVEKDDAGSVIAVERFPAEKDAGTVTAVERFPVEKDDTDTMLAVRKALEAGCGEIHIYGGTGGVRLDHTLANLQALAFLAVRGVRGYLYDKGFVYTAVHDSSITVSRSKDSALLSVFSMTTESTGVDLAGVQYPLEDATLTYHFPLGVSNHILEPQARISVKKGCLLIGLELED